MNSVSSLFRTALALAAAAALAACNDDRELDDDHEEGGHVHVAPNGGTLVELGDHFANLEFLLDVETGTLTMHTWGAHAESAVRVPNESVVVTCDTHGASTFEVTLAAEASALSGETVGDSSTFRGVSDALKGVDHFHGVLTVVSVMETEFRDVTFDYPGEHDHDDEGDVDGGGGEG